MTPQGACIELQEVCPGDAQDVCADPENCIEIQEVCIDPSNICQQSQGIREEPQDECMGGQDNCLELQEVHVEQTNDCDPPNANYDYFDQGGPNDIYEGCANSEPNDPCEREVI